MYHLRDPLACLKGVVKHYGQLTALDGEAAVRKIGRWPAAARQFALALCG